MFHFHAELTPDIIDPEQLRTLARDKGYTAQRALRENLWRLTKADGTLALDPATQDTGFHYLDAIEFLKQQPEQF
jgi:hypothetical protein